MEWIDYRCITRKMVRSALLISSAKIQRSVTVSLVERLKELEKEKIRYP